MAKDNREFVWLQCTETGDLNYRTQLKVKGIDGNKKKFEGMMKFCPRLQRHTKHKVKKGK